MRYQNRQFSPSLLCVLVLVSTIMAAAPASAQTPAAWWKFDDGTGTTAVDSSGNGYNATLFNGTSWATGKIGDAVSANGTNQYVSTPAVNLSATNAVTVTMWVNRTYSTSGGHTLLEATTNFNSSTTGFGVFPDDGTCRGIQADLHGDVGYTANCYTAPSSGVWHHLAFVFDKSQTGSNEVALYLDGVLQTPSQNYLASNNTNNFGSNPIYIFSRGGTQEYTAGSVDDVRIYGSALTASQIQQIFNGATLTSIVVTPATPSIAKGNTLQFSATGNYSDGSQQNLTNSVTWTSTSTTVATISSTGLATTVGTGNTTIQANSGTLGGSTQFTVTPPTLMSLSIAPLNPSVVKSTNQQFTATGTYSDGSQQNLTSVVAWSSTNTGVATISGTGLATGVATGNTTVQASSGSTNASTTLTVTASLLSIVVTPSNPSVAKGVAQQFTATGNYSDGSQQNLTNSVSWTSSSTSVATISGTGVASTVGTGTSTIQASSGAVSGSAVLTVTPPSLLSIAVFPANPSMVNGATQQFTATGNYSDGTQQNLTSSATWSSSNTAVATISNAGLATGLGIGTTSIQATSGSISNFTSLTVTAQLPGLVGYWTFDAGAGTTAADSSGNGYNATLVNGVSWVTGKLGDAVSANGTNQYVTIPAVSLSSTNAVTVAMWVNRTYSTSGGHTLLEASTNFNGSTTAFGIFPDDAGCKGIAADLQGNAGYVVNCYAAPSSAVWHHLAFIFDKSKSGGSEVSLYIDGVQQTTTQTVLSSNNTNNFGNNPLYLFSRGGTQEFTAAMVDDLRVYSRALSTSEIQEVYAGPVLNSITVTPSAPSIAKGNTVQFTATGKYSDGSQQNLATSVNWNSSATTVATINSSGLATTVGTGNTTIQASSGSISGSTVLTATPATLVSLSVTPLNSSIVKGTTQQFTATGTYSDGSQQNLTTAVTWSSSNTAAATISSSGLATGVATGNTTIQASSGSINASTVLTVTSTLVSITVTPANPSVAKGVAQQFTATGNYSDATQQNLTNSVTWSSTSTTVATISSSGTAASVGTGSTTIQATSGSIKGSTLLTVTPAALVSITVTPANPAMTNGATQQFTATGNYSDGTQQNLSSSATWTSSNTAVATISSAGLATGTGTGTTTINAASGSLNGSTALTVTPPLGHFIQWSSGDTGAALVSRTYMNNNVANGNLLLVFSHWDNQTLTASVTDNAGNTYVPVSGPINVGSVARFQAWYAKDVVGGPIGVTVTYTGTTSSISLVDAIEYSGLDTTAPLDVFASAQGSGVTQDSGSSPATTSSNETIVGLFGYYGYATPYTSGPGYTFRNYDATSMLEDQSVTANGSYHATGMSAVSVPWVAYVICFKNAFQGPLSLTLNPSTVIGGNAITGSVVLSAPAPAGGATIALSTNNQAVATVPSNVVVPSGATSAPFTIGTGTVAFNTAVNVSATYESTVQNAILTVDPAAMAQVANDTFNRANASTLGSNWTPLVGSGDVALQISGSQIESNALTPSVGKEMYYGGLTWSPDQYSQAEIVKATGNGYVGPAVRMTSNDTHYACVVFNTGSGNATVEILLDNAGTYTVLAGAVNSTVRAGDTVRCLAQGSTLTMTNQTTSATLLSATDTTIPSGYPGLVDAAGTSSATNYVMANWAGGAGLAPMTAQQIASDNFNRADAPNLGTSWHIGAGHGPIQIVNQQIEPYPSGGPQPSKEHYVAAGVFPNDQWSQIQIINEDTLGDDAVELRASDTSDTLYVLDVNIAGAPGTAETRIAAVINGVITPLIVDTTWSSVAPGDYIRGQVQGNLLSLIDVTTGTLLISAFDTNITSGYAGISMQADTGTPADHIGANWSGGTFH